MTTCCRVVDTVTLTDTGSDRTFNCQLCRGSYRLYIGQSGKNITLSSQDHHLLRNKSYSYASSIAICCNTKIIGQMIPICLSLKHTQMFDIIKDSSPLWDLMHQLMSKKRKHGPEEHYKSSGIKRLATGWVPWWLLYGNKYRAKDACGDSDGYPMNNVCYVEKRGLGLFTGNMIKNRTQIKCIRP